MVARVLFLFVLMGTMFSGAALAQDLDISGSLDGYYMFSANRPINQAVPFRAFDTKHSQFSLNYAELVVEKKAAPLGFRADIGFGDASKAVHAFEPATVNGGSSLYQYLQQAFVMAKVNDKVQLDFGKFVTPFGAEVIETKDNWNYSRGLLFNYAVPFYHFGLRATVTPNEKMSYGFYLVNGWNNVQDNNSAKSFAVSATFKPFEKLTLVTNAMVGEEQPNVIPFTNVSPFGGGQLSFATPGNPATRLVDVIATLKLDDNVSLMMNYDYGTLSRQDWKGVAGYAKLKVHDRLTIIPRYEWFSDTDGYVTGNSQTLQEHTLTFMFPINDDSSVYLEYRRDWNRKSDPATFFAHGGYDITDPSNTLLFEPRHFQHTFTLGWTYNFKKE